MITGLSRHWWCASTANNNNSWPHKPDQETTCPSRGPLDKCLANRSRDSGSQPLFTNRINEDPYQTKDNCGCHNNNSCLQHRPKGLRSRNNLDKEHPCTLIGDKDLEGLLSVSTVDSLGIQHDSAPSLLTSSSCHNSKQGARTL